jgi:hypothetical protein
LWAADVETKRRAQEEIVIQPPALYADEPDAAV